MRKFKKLKLKKEVIAKISDNQMKGLRGGYNETMTCGLTLGCRDVNFPVK